MAALLDWADDDDAPAPPPRPLKPVLRPGELPASVEAAIWRGDQLGSPVTRVVASGYRALDAELPGGGWPARSLTEVLQAQPTVLEWRLLAPAMREVVAQGEDIVIVGPPKAPHLPGLRDEGIDERRLVWIQAANPAERLWVTEQLVKANAAGMVVSWLPQARQEQIRRLQVCAQSCDSPVFLCRPAAAVHEPSAAPLRLQVSVGIDWELRVHLLKRKGGVHDGVLHLPSIPRGLAPLITPRLSKPSVLLAARKPRATSTETSHALGSATSRPPAHRLPAY
ncbi:translesion DNA synthesis-associated protein ImuA [Variovorax sp. J22P271]|uniref:translesion DNA synthesis-associated protein ImuA n=1 Tax=Variovorax davisae TaxID=3053515 RepID=UPI002574E398|nr:translesion DNA synthesis-associated protein ImuA [Variovorax sp. J22P271]MDM0037231.1 translesion DNA synthesis-associated protein ImuA [Variovorax sp. J22P271]